MNTGMKIEYCTMWDISWLAEQLLASQMRLCSTELVNYFKQKIWARSLERKDWGVWWRSWLRLCATTRRVAGSIPEGVIGIFH